jgi:hypothetical protein
MDYLNGSKQIDELVQRVTDKVEADFVSGKISITLDAKPLDDAIEEINNRLKNLGQ